MLVGRTHTCSIDHKMNICKVKCWMSSLVSFVYLQAYFCWGLLIEFIGGLLCVVLLWYHASYLTSMAVAVQCVPHPPRNGSVATGNTPVSFTVPKCAMPYWTILFGGIFYFSNVELFLLLLVRLFWNQDLFLLSRKWTNEQKLQDAGLSETIFALQLNSKTFLLLFLCQHCFTTLAEI